MTILRSIHVTANLPGPFLKFLFWLSCLPHVYVHFYTYKYMFANAWKTLKGPGDVVLS